VDSTPHADMPAFDRDFLVEIGGWAAYRRAKWLADAGAVISAAWRPPRVEALVADAGEERNPRLNLRSSVFVENTCECESGRRGTVCAHAVAACLALSGGGAAASGSGAGGAERESEPSPKARERPEASGDDPPAPADGASLRSLRIDRDNGTRLRVLVLVPPNLGAAVERGAVVVKLEAAAGKTVTPLNQLDAEARYAPNEAHEAALWLLERWGGGRLGALVQLAPEQLRDLLDTLRGEPAIYWLKGSSEPIAWQGDALPGVSELLPAKSAVERAETQRARERAESGERADARPEGADSGASRENDGGSGSASAAPQVRRDDGVARASDAPPPQTNPRREAEAGAFGAWEHKRGDHPAAKGRGPAFDADDDASRTRIDGSPNYLAVRLPSGDRRGASDLRDALKAHGFTLDPRTRTWWLRDRHKVLNFLSRHWKALEEEWQASFSENFREQFASVRRSEPEVEVRENGGAFELEIGLGGGHGDTELRRAIAGGRAYVEDDRGGITILDNDAVERMHRLEQNLSGQADRPFSPTFRRRLSNPELADAEKILEEEMEGWQPPETWRSRSRALREVGALAPPPVPGALDERLRGYQRIGAAWLWHLYGHGLGGILADEMGLGKTIQALALIACVRSEGDTEGPALVVGPASLVENWAREAARFVPELAAVRHHGPKRAKEAHALENADIVITSYGTLRQDEDLLSALEWGLIVGDEAQHIKNRRTRNARSLARLRGKRRFLLTGTPVENSIDDLLSLFAFLMPGYLEKPPPKLGPEDKAWHARRQTQRAASYILRRTKRDVAPELPEKIERTLFCSMDAKQAKLYRETLDKTRKEIFNMEMEGANDGRVRMAALTQLLRLRQACVDPRLLDENKTARDSAKARAFEEILEECVDAGSRMLVFSSFVGALRQLAEDLEAAGHRYCYLDGQTRDRMEVCDTFNNDPGIPVFLISLKAGGSGLNLAGADTVVHYDPWWNPAAEAQATDRAHRIGQRRTVTSIRLIVSDSVEEKVLELQRQKAEILRDLFEQSDAANAQVSLDEIKSLLE